MQSQCLVSSCVIPQLGSSAGPDDLHQALSYTWLYGEDAPQQGRRVFEAFNRLDHRFPSGVRGVELLRPLLRPYLPEEMSACAVSLLVNDPANEGPRCAEPSGAARAFVRGVNHIL